MLIVRHKLQPRHTLEVPVERPHQRAPHMNAIGNRTDFSVYRLNDRKPFRILPETE